MSPVLFLRHKVYCIEPYGFHDLIDHTDRRGKEQSDHTTHNHGRNEVRCVGYRLNDFTVFLEPKRVQHQRQDDRKRERYKQSIQTQDQSVLDRRSEIWG